MHARRGKGFTLIELLITVAIIAILAAIAIPNLQGALRRSRYSRAAADTKQAVAQAVVYASDMGGYPSTIAAMRTNGYTNVPDDDPWGTAYQLSPVLLASQPPAVDDDIYIFTRGASRAGTYPVPFAADTGSGGSAGYSSVYGAWAGW